MQKKPVNCKNGIFINQKPHYYYTMPQKNSRTASIAQASLEYLLTYGWALILIATIMGILVIIFLPPGGYACSGTGDLICRALGAEGEDLVLSFQNKLPFDIIINPYTGIRFDGRAGYASIKYRGTTYRFEDVTIGKGDQFQVTGIGLGDASSVSITYTETATGFEQTWTGGTTTPQKEVCNDGIDNDTDGKTDALDDECETGTSIYVTPVTGPAGIAPTFAVGTPLTLTFDSTETTSLISSTTGTDWDVTSAYLYFYVPTDPGSGVHAVIGGKQSVEEIKQGWNSVTIENFTIPQRLDDRKLVLSGSSGGFSINGADSAEKPKLLIKTTAAAPP